MRPSCSAIVALLACVATTAPDVAGGSTTGGTRAPGPDLASGGVVAPDPAPVESSAPKHKTANRAPPPATTPAPRAPAPSAPAPSPTRSVVATAAVATRAAPVKRSSRHAAKRPRRPHHQHRSEARVARASPIARIVALPSRRLVSQATGSRGSDGRLLRAAVALFLVALAEGSLLVRLATELPRGAR
jgi:hypothetical protein